MNRQIPFRRPQGWKWTILVVLSLCLALPLLPVQAQVSSKHVLDSHRMIIKFRQGSQLLRLAREQSASLSRLQTSRDLSSIQTVLGIERLRALKPDATLDPLPGGVERIFIALLADSVDVGESLATARGLKEIEYAEPVSTAGEAATGIEEGLGLRVSDETSGFPNDPKFPQQWALHNTGTNGGASLGKAGADLCMIPAWEITTGSSEIVVAFLSSGLHQGFEFSGRVLRTGYNFLKDNTDITDVSSFSLGTLVTSVAAATGNNSYAMAGVDWKCSILPIKVIGESVLDFSLDWLARGIVYAADKGANVICLGLGNKLDGAAFDDAATYAAARGSIIVATKPAAYFGSSYPRAYDHILVVGGVDSRGMSIDIPGHVDFVVPGRDILGLQSSNNTRLTNAPNTPALASGVVSLMLSLNKYLSFREVYDILKESAVDQAGRPDQDKPGWDEYHGWGRINAYRALRIIQERSKAVPQAFGVSQNYPNPFNSSTVIQYELRFPMHVSITVYNVLGQPVVTLLDEEKQAGYHHVRWDANVASGVYIYRLNARPPSGSHAGERVIVKKMMLVK